MCIMTQRFVVSASQRCTHFYQSLYHKEELKTFYFTAVEARLPIEQTTKKRSTEFFPLAQTPSFTYALAQLVFPFLPMCFAITLAFVNKNALQKFDL